MLRHDCFHLKRVTNNDIHEGNKGTLRCDVNRAAPDGTTVAGISCPKDCMGYRPVEMKKNNSPLAKFKDRIMSLIGID
jgi:hypothetical protein